MAIDFVKKKTEIMLGYKCNTATLLFTDPRIERILDSVAHNYIKRQ